MTTNFNNYFPWMWEEAKRQGMKKREWFIKSGMTQHRFSEFAVGSGLRDGPRSRNISSYYFIMLVKGLGLNPHDVEAKSKMKFTAEQQLELERTMKQQSRWTFSQDDIEKYPFLASLVVAVEDGDEELLKATIKNAYKKYIKGK